MRKNLKRIASLAIACVLLSVPAFAALDGSYNNGTYTVTGGETNLQTSLIIVKDACDELPVASETVTGAVYINQVAAADTGNAAFTGITLPETSEVFTAFFANENEGSSAKETIVTTTVDISIEDATDAVAATVGEELVITVDGSSALVTDENTVFYVDDVETDKIGTIAEGLKFTPAEAKEYKVKVVSTIAGVLVESNEITITATAAELGAEVLIGTTNKVLELVVSPTTDYAGLPVGIQVTLPESGKSVEKMIWAFKSGSDYYYSTPQTLTNVKANGSAVFAAVVKNGDVVDGVVTNDVKVDEVGAIFSIGGQDFYTNEVYDDHKKTN